MGKYGPEEERKLPKVTQQASLEVGLPGVSWLLSDAPTPGSQDHASLLLAIRSSGHVGSPFPGANNGLALCSMSSGGSSSAGPQTHRLLPLPVPASPQSQKNGVGESRGQEGLSEGLPCPWERGEARGGGPPRPPAGGPLTVPRLQENWPRKSCSSSCALDLSWSNRANWSFCTSSKW